MNEPQPEKPTARDIMQQARKAAKLISDMPKNELREETIKAVSKRLGIEPREFRRLLRA